MGIAILPSPLRELVRPDVVVTDASGEVLVVDAQEAGLLQVRRGEPPSALLVAVDPVGQHLPERLVDAASGAALDLGVARVLVEREVKRREHRGRQRVEAQPDLAAAPGRFVQRRAQQTDLDEVVEVTGLERGVLAMVAEAQQLARLGGSDSSLRRLRTAESPRMVVLVLRPPAPSVESFPKSAVCRAP